MTEIEEEGELKDKLLRAEWKNHCIRSDKVIDAIKQEYSHFQVNQKLKQQVLESRRLVADQLQGVSRVMGDFAKEIQKEKEAHHLQEEQMLDALRSAGLEIGHIDIYSWRREV